MEEISRGAEAIISLENGDIVKDRIKKGYRIEELDESLRKQRTKNETKILLLAQRAGVPVPTVRRSSETEIVMEHINGERLRDITDSMDEKSIKDVFFSVGENIGKLHRNGIIHGDLTTSNMILLEKVYFIDFGLAFQSLLVEDKAVDIYLLKKAIESTHLAKFDLIWNSVVSGYKESYNDSLEVIKRMKSISERGRYKEKTVHINQKIKEMGK